MAPDRRVSVTLDANTGPYNRALLGATAATMAFSREADRADTSVGGLDTTLGGSTRQLDRFTGRLGLLVDTAATIGPSLIPIAAVGIPAVMGLASSLGFALVGAGGVAAAMYGVGDSLKALNAYALKPTDENLLKVQQTLGKLAPDAQEFVLRLRDMGPELAQIRDAGAGELFPHWQDALDSLETLLPTVEELVTRVTGKVGQLSEQGADALASPEWLDFFSFLEKETPKAIDGLATTTGHLAHAAAELWMAFDPLNDDFLDVLVKGSQEIDDWATGLSKTEGFKEFIDYVEANGPRVADTVGAVAMGLIQIAEAGAPIGAAVLPVLTLLANIIGTIADSDLGTPLLAVLALSRGMSLLDRGIQTGPISSVRMLGADIKTMASTSVVAWGRSAEETERYNKAAERTRTTLGKFGKTAGVIGGLALAQSGLADKVGLTNTVMGASVGLMAGPYGAAIGGLVGLGLDLVKSQDSAAVSVEDLTATLDRQTGALTENTSATVANALEKSGALEAAQQLGIGLDLVTDAALGNTDAFHLLALGYAANQSALTGLDDDARETAQGQESAWNTLIGAVNGSVPAVAEAVASGKRLAGATEEHAEAAKRAVGPTRDVAQAIADLGDHELSTAEKSDALKASLDALLGPGLDVSAAWDAWNVGLRDLNKSLSEHGNRLRGMTRDATENRAEIRSRVEDLSAMIQAEADAGVKGPKLAEILRNQTKALLDAGEAAGLSRPQLKAYLDTLGLTPKLIETVLKVVGDEEAKRKARHVKEGVEGIPDLKSLTIEANNAQALAALAAVQRARDALRDKLITITIAQHGVKLDNAGHSGGGGADGDPTTPQRTLLGGKNGRTTLSFDPRLTFASGSGGVATGSGGNATGSGPFGFDTKNQHEVDKEIRAAFASLKLSLADGAGSIRRELRELESDLKKVGGVWNDAMSEQADKILRLAHRYDAQAKLLENQQHVLEGLNSTLSDMQQAQQAFVDQVAGNFTSDPFGNGLAGFFATTGKDTAQATMFDQVLQQLSVMGLDGEAFKALAASGDIKTAQQLAASGMIDAFESAIANRDMATGGLGNQAAVSAGMVEQGRATALAITAQTAVVQASMDVMTQMSDRLEGLRADLKGETGVKMAKENGRELGKVLNGVAAGAKRQAH